MFKKKPNIKPLAPLRSSDRRRTADQIISDLSLTIPSSEETDPEAKAAATAALTSLRNSLLPDNALSARFTTTSGPELKQISGTLYVGSHAGEEQRVLWVKVEERLYPTVYSLWHNPGIVPLLHTPAVVVQKLQGGADLMTPGLARGPPFPEGAKKGAIVAIATTEAPSIPQVVGVCEIDVSALGQVQGAKGHAVRTVHWFGDELWAWSTSGKPGGNAPESLSGWDDSGDHEDHLTHQMHDLSLDAEEAEGGVPLDVADTGGGTERQEVQISATADPEAGADEEAMAHDEVDMTTKDIDDAFRKAFLYGVHHYKETTKAPPNFGLDFPLTQSFVMSNLVQPFLPAFTPAQANSLQIKKTSWKNIRKFIKSLDKQQIIKSKERDGNEVVIFDIDFDDHHITNFVPYRLPKKETAAGTSISRGEKATTTPETSEDAVGQRLKKIELYRPKEKFSDIFTTASADLRGLYTAAEIRPLITRYIESENLVSPSNKRLITLNPTLANAVFDGSAPLDKEVIAKGTVPRDALVDRIIQSCAPFWTIVRNDDAAQTSTAKPKAGAAPKIHITLETRSGNKTVTKVSGVEPYFIAPQPLADELRKACAGSTSVDRLVGSSPKNPVMEIMVQGPQKDAVIKALERRGVDKRWIEVLDKTKGKKKS